MRYEAKNYDGLIGITGLSENLLKNHFTLYQGYVNNVNKLSEEFAKLDKNGEKIFKAFSSRPFRKN